MTPREFLAVALMLATNGTERLMVRAAAARDAARSDFVRDYWAAYYEEDALTVGAIRALWLEAQPCGWWAGSPKPGHEEQTRYRFDPDDWNPCCEPAARDGMCSVHAAARAEIEAMLGEQP